MEGSKTGMKLFRKNGTPYQSALKRVPLKIRFKVVGHDEYGFPFENEAETVDVGPGGGCLTFDKDVKTGENLRLYSPKGDLFLVNVRWFKYDMRSDRRYVGFKLLEPARGWVVENPKDGRFAGVDPGVSGTIIG
jgi:hypothetical protein